MKIIEACSILEIDEVGWDLVTNGVLQMSHRWLRVVESCWRYYKPRYLLLENDDGPYAAILANTAVAVEKEFGLIGWLYQRSSLVVRSPFSSLCSVMVRSDIALDAVMPEINTIFNQLCRQEKRLMIAVGNVDNANVSNWKNAGYMVAPKSGVSIIELPETYNDYLKSLRSKDRKEIRRVRKKAAEYNIRLETGKLGDDPEEIYALLCEVYANHGVLKDDMPFSSQFLVSLAQEMPEDVLLIRSYVGDRLVGVSLNLLDGSRLLVLMMGLYYEIARPSLLYFVLMDELIRLGIELGFRQVYIGRTNEKEKRKHGFQLDDRWICYRSNIQPLNRLLRVASQLLIRGLGSSDEEPHTKT